MASFVCGAQQKCREPSACPSKMAERPRHCIAWLSYCPLLACRGEIEKTQCGCRSPGRCQLFSKSLSPISFGITVDKAGKLGMSRFRENCRPFDVTIGGIGLTADRMQNEFAKRVSAC
jgi:hypothetical protein